MGSLKFIGLPGSPPRLAVNHETNTESLLDPGEVVVVGELADWIIGQDGASLIENIPPLALLRERAYMKIDTEAESIRSRYITPGSGQAITYLRKELEAEAYLADPAHPTPILSAEAAAIGQTLEVLANEVYNNAQLWLTIGSKIEAARRGAKIDVGSANTKSEIDSASDVDWDSVVNN